MQNTTDVMPPLPDDFLFCLDPFQARAVRLSTTSDHIWVHGDSNPKRLQVLMHLLMHHAAKGQSTLICADEVTRQHIREFLKSYGLDHFAIQLHSPASPTVLAALQVARKKESKEDTLTQCDLAVNQYCTWKDTQEGPFVSMERKVFGDLTWKQLADQAATGPRDTFKSQLAASLVTSDFSMSQKEFWYIKGRIKTFQRLRILRTPAFDVLNHLHDRIFEDTEDADIKIGIETTLVKIIDQGRTLLRQIGELVNKYRRDITGAQHETLEDYKSQIHHLETLIVSGEMQFGNEFYAESTFNEITDRIRRTVSRKSRAMTNMRGDIREAYRKLIDSLITVSIKSKHIEEDLLDDPLTMESISGGLERCKKLLNEWSNQIEAEATDHKRRLNAQNIPEGHVLRNMIGEVEQRIQENVDRVNSQLVFAELIEVNALSLEKRGMVIKDMVTKCMKLQNAMVDFEAYFLWRSFWSKLNDNERTLLEGLDIMDDGDQLHAFEAWYFENILDQIPAARIAQKSIDAQKFDEQLGEMRAVVLNHIKNTVRQRRHIALKEMRSTQKPLIMSIAKSKHALLNEELKILPAKLLMQLFPVVFCSTTDLRDYGYYSDMLCVVDESGADYKAYLAQSQRCMMLTRTIPKQPDPAFSKLKFAELPVRHLSKPFPWNELPATGKLQQLQALSSQFEPFIKELRIYHTKSIQILSFLGDTCDRYILDKLKLPYKEMTDDGVLNVQHIIEALLDVRKPVVLLVRDLLLGYQCISHLYWQSVTLDLISRCGLPVVNTWSMDIKLNGMTALDQVVNDLTALTPVTPAGQNETHILEQNDQSGTAQLQGPPPPSTTRFEIPDFRSNSKKVGGIPA